MTERIRHDYRVAYRHPKKRTDAVRLYLLAALLLVMTPVMLALMHDAYTYEYEGDCYNCIVLDIIRPGLGGGAK